MPSNEAGSNPFRTDPVFARQVIRKRLPDAEQRQAVLRLFAELIEEASENPGGWGVTLSEDEVSLNVGNGQRVIWLHPGILHLFWLGEGQAEPPAAADGSPSVPGLRLAQGTPGEALGWVPGIRQQITSLIRYANAKWPVLHGNCRKAHSPGALRYIEEELHIPLPAPVYPQAIVSPTDTSREPGTLDVVGEAEIPQANVSSSGTFGRRPQPQILRIVVASPGDVQDERDAVEEVAKELNHGVAAMAGLRIEIARWETDAYPGFHPQGPQGLIDPLLKIADCDVLIGIFWKRFGTPTGDAKSGTEHEFRIAYEAWKRRRSPQIMVYFNQKAYMPQSKAEIEQLGQVLDFKESFPKEGLWWPYNRKREFERLVRHHLTQWIRRRIAP